MMRLPHFAAVIPVALGLLATTPALAGGSGPISPLSPGSTGGMAVPEPGMLGLFGMGLIAMALVRQRRR